MEEGQQKLDDEMEKRKRRVQEWQEKRRKKEEYERARFGGIDESAGKTWTLDGECDEGNADGGHMDLEDKVKGTDKINGVVNGLDDGDVVHALPNGGDMEEDEIDPLDAFMNYIVIPEVNKLSYSEASVLDKKSSYSKKDDKNKDNQQKNKKSGARSMGWIIPGDDSEEEYPDVDKEEDGDAFLKRVKKFKLEKLSLVDHSTINYFEFRKNFYIEVNEIKKMTQDEVATYRKELELKVHGKDVPKPIKTWYQTGLTTKILETIRTLKYDKPMPIQAQAFPVIMSGRDCIGVAKTGSGKTLAFILPMLRHIMDQPKLCSGDSPIGLVMAPTRELVRQIHGDIRKFTKVLGIRCVPVYGGSGVAQQIKELKLGAEIVVCTPGRMIDVLCTSADRMFDMGFEPQITRIVHNIQPNRQTVLFSATFPRKVEMLARKVLNKPVEIQVGGRSVVNKHITQLVENKCDALFTDLYKQGFKCLSLHGAKDQSDRESTISDFKSNVCGLLIATSIAARGLDVKELELVVNYDAPNHYEDYVHCVGRTGRAGRKGCAVTFLSSEDERYAPDLVKALALSNQAVPDDLKALADQFTAKVNKGLVRAHGTGYGGSGFNFSEEEDEVRKAAKKAQAKEYGFEDKSDSDDESDGVSKSGGDISQQAVHAPDVAASQQPSTGGVTAALVAAMRQHVLAKIQAGSLHEHYEDEPEINDLPQNARWKVTHKETLGPVVEWSGASVTTRGRYIQPGRIVGSGEKKLHLFIEGANEQSVKRSKAELKRVLEGITSQASLSNSKPGRYSF
ncbi:putative RNA helicase [Helianthus debilis subsp. tardiflorus]